MQLIPGGAPRTASDRSKARCNRVSFSCAALFCLVLVSVGSCGGEGSYTPTLPEPPEFPNVCENYPDWETSPYDLPYPVGRSFLVQVGNCAPAHIPTHHGRQRYAYDFEMPIGNSILAAREGMVSFIIDRFDDRNNTADTSNIIEVRHLDGTYGVYAHMTHGGIRVSVGDSVSQGDLLGISGAAGALFPHLHFDVRVCSIAVQPCETLPVTFRNTDPNPNGLEEGVAYPALF